MSDKPMSKEELESLLSELQLDPEDLEEVRRERTCNTCYSRYRRVVRPPPGDTTAPRDSD